ncbi:hypothetical protein GCM10011581_16610 [Saccharopolyspora subtropica]|uniref:Insertion element protein n=1 Tax=Saccharopolyspora thermophila TaxID=89367 RepID=A0A917JSY8_9PSEU|nr:hypothetical protein [Saccharopolyspora subtropica]GGI80033.1 hypothetical protein GCM10011581_16610 [Saccharopolyspora subtropica]
MSQPERAVPLHCPYCGDEDLAPEAEPAGAWTCLSCRRVFTVRLVGLALGGNGEP